MTPSHPDDVTVKRPGKVLYREAGLTKQDIIDYYLDVSSRIIPWMKDRPLSMERYPDGIDQAGFFQKAAPNDIPDWIRTETVKKEDGAIEHIICEHPATLAWLVNRGAVTFHIWLSRSDKPYRPDCLVLDFDPPESDFEPARHAALFLGELFRENSIPSYPMLTGSKGVHVVVPLDRQSDFDTVRESARGLAETVSRMRPDTFTTEQRKDRRKGRVFIDYLRNSYGQTFVCPYSLRPIPPAPCATPVTWKELKNPDVNAQSYPPSSMRRRIAQQKSNPWEDFVRRAVPVALLDKIE